MPSRVPVPEDEFHDGRTRPEVDISPLQPWDEGAHLAVRLDQKVVVGRVSQDNGGMLGECVGDLN